jgi:hypothetical protein
MVVGTGGTVSSGLLLVNESKKEEPMTFFTASCSRDADPDQTIDD